MSFFSSVSFFSNRALCTSCCCTEIQWCLASDDDNEKNKQTNKRCAPSSFLEGTVAVAWNGRRGRHHVSFFFHTGARWRQICILIELSFPSFLPSSSQRTWPSLPHVSRPNLRAQHSLTKNNKHIETIQRLQRPCSRDARLPFFSSGRRPPKLGRRP